MQKNIESFFKPMASTLKSAPSLNLDDSFVEKSPQKQPEIRIKYTRKAIDANLSSRENGLFEREEFPKQKGTEENLEVVTRKEKVLNKKRSYAQFHLELGQSDFLLHTCKICGINYTKGDETDEKVHSTFHKNYTLGISFKGWCHERVIDLPSLEKDHVILVLDCDPPPQKKKVQEVVKMMEIELGDGWIFHELCKVYLYISSKRIAGCIIVESINTAYRILSDSVDKVYNDASGKAAVSKQTTLQFGGVTFRREVSRKGASLKRSGMLDSDSFGTIVCEEEPVSACCGVRAIWVSPSNRRKRIASHLLDSVRKSFRADNVIEPSQLAFSQPTSSGKALALKYTGTKSFLVYKDELHTNKTKPNKRSESHTR